MKKYRAIIFIVLLMLITGVMAALHLNSREVVPEGAIEVSYGEEKYIVDIHELAYENVSGIRVNGKGEEIPVEGAGILLKDLLAKLEITEFVTVSVVADDAYIADVTAEEIKNNIEAYLIQEEGEERLRLVVFGDKDSKRSVSNVAQIIVKEDDDDFDLIVSNPPYLTKEDMENLQQEVKSEPRMALYGEEDGLFFYRELTRIYRDKLKKGGMLIYEIGDGQHSLVKEILLQNGFKDISQTKDYNGIIRCVAGIKP